MKRSSSHRWPLGGGNAVHPWQHIAEQLQAIDMSAAELACKLGVPARRIELPF